MITLNKREYNAVIRAAKWIDSGLSSYSCMALGKSIQSNVDIYHKWWDRAEELERAYCSFYNQKVGDYWLGMDHHDWSSSLAELEKRRNLRVMLLLLFAEVHYEA